MAKKVRLPYVPLYPYHFLLCVAYLACFPLEKSSINVLTCMCRQSTMNYTGDICGHSLTFPEMDPKMPKSCVSRPTASRGENCLRNTVYVIVTLLIFALVALDVYLASRTDSSKLVKPLVAILNQTLKSSLNDAITE